MPWKATEIVRFLEAFKNLGFLKKTDGFFEKILKLFEIAKDSKFAVECNWNSEISQNVQNLGFFKKNRWVFRKNLEFFENR